MYTGAEKPVKNALFAVLDGTLPFLLLCFCLLSLFSLLLLRVPRSTFLLSQILGSIESDKKRLSTNKGGVVDSSIVFVYSLATLKR